MEEVADMTGEVLMSLGTAFDIFMVYFVLRCFFEKNEACRKVKIGVLSVFLVCVLGFQYVGYDFWIMCVLKLMIGVLMSLLLFYGTISSRIFMVLSVSVFILGLQLMTLLFFSYCTTISIGAYITYIPYVNNNQNILAVLVDKLILFAVFLAFPAKKIRHRVVKFPKLLFVFPALGILFITATMEKQSSPADLSQIISAVCCLLLSVAGMVLLFLYSERDFIKKQLEKQDSVLKDLDIFQQKFRSVWHDFRNHTICMQGLLLEGNYEKLKEYMAELCSFSKDANPKISTGNIIFDSILKEKKQQAEKNNIEFAYRVDLPNGVYIDALDLCIVLGNIFDNAIEACMRMKDPSIKKKMDLVVGLKNDYMNISLENSADDDIKITKENSVVSKKNAYGHGIGLNNVKDTVEKYYGNIFLNYKKPKFTVLIIMKNIEKKNS